MPMLEKCFIEPEGIIDPKAFKPASYLRKTFSLEKEIKSALLTITACGIYEGYINGTPVTDEIFTPGFTYYRDRLQYQTYDVTPLLNQGENVIGAILGDGWYRGKIGVSSKRNYYGEKTKLAAVLEITFADGSQTNVSTDESWKATQDGPILKSDWKDGDIVDARKELTGWNTAGYDDSSWHGVYKGNYDGQLVPSEGEKILEHERFTPEVLVTPDGSTVLDFKQNLFGYMEFTVTGKSGHQVSIYHGEILDENGNFTTKNLVPEGGLNKVIMKPGPFQEIHYTLKEGKQTYKTHFSAQGFRYVKLVNWPEDVRPENFTSIAVYSDMEEIGHFTCSDPDINQLVKNSLWSQKGNFMDIPTDCPTRERAGWTGDISSFCQTGSYLMNTDKFLSKWLKDLALQQTEDGCVASIVPDVGMPAFMDGSAGWADAAVTVPYNLYRMYGNKQVLIDQYESMCKWVGFMVNRAKKTRFRNRFKKNPYQEFVIDTGYHWGEWLEPGHVMGKDVVNNVLLGSDSEVATAYFAYSTGLLAEIANVLGKTEDARKYNDLTEKIKEAYRYTFTYDGMVQSDRHCRYVRPVALNMLPEMDKEKIVAKLNQMVIDNDYKIGTGFLTTPFILGVLTDYGYAETAYKMVDNKQRPGWLYEVQNGATTIWENWNGIDEDRVPRDSFNHYTFGAVTGWFFSHVAGIQPLEPGFKRVKIQPIPGGKLDHVDCSYNSTAGLISSSWKVNGSEFSLSVEVPTDTEVVMPDGNKHLVSPGKHTFNCTVD